MRKHTASRSFAMASILAAGLAAGSALYAQDGPRPSRPDRAPGMMGEDGMMGMMGMMRRMNRMMDRCADMMGESDRPNDRSRGDTPATPDKR